MKGQDVESDTPHSNNSGESTRHTHCPLDGNYSFFSTDCDGTILVGTECEFWFLCKERETSNRVKLTCQEDGRWQGRMLENGEREVADPNCYPDPSHMPTQAPVYSTREPSHMPTQAPVYITEEYVCSHVCPNSRTCSVCKDEEFPPTVCDVGAIECEIERAKSTTSFVGQEKCVSYSTTREICIANGGDFVVQLQTCVSSTLGLEGCTTEARETGVQMAAVTKISGGKKACHLILGYMCDRNSGLKSMDYVVVVDEDQPCPTIQDPSFSCDLLSESNKVISPPEEEEMTGGGGGCLDFDSQISLADGTTQPIDSLQVGSDVALGNDAKSAIVFFSYADKKPEMRNVVTIKTQETSITATPNHLIFSNEKEDVTLFNLRAFEDVKVGDYILMDSESGPVSTKVTNIISRRILTRVFNAVPRAGYLIANKIFVASGVAFWVLPHWLQYPVVHAVSMLICGISERVCRIEENDTEPKWVRTILGWIAAMDLSRASSAMMLTGS